jgi:hypothetical protein
LTKAPGKNFNGKRVWLEVDLGKQESFNVLSLGGARWEMERLRAESYP